MRLFLLLLATLSGALGCAPAVSNQSMGLVDPSISFELVLQDPGRYSGRYLLVGGAVAAVRVSESGGSELEVVQLPTDKSGRITSTDRSVGRFIVLDQTFRDPAIYSSGRLVTLVGKVVGSRAGELAGQEYLYPVLNLHELRLWAPEEYPGSTPVHFGIGIGIGVFDWD